MHLRHCVLFFPDWVHSPRFLPGCGRVHVQGCRDGHFVFASRLGSLSTVFTWLRSRACAGIQGLGVLALVVVAPCGFAAVASEEAVLSSPRNRCGNGICTNPYHLAPRHRSPWRPPEPQTWGLGASGTPCHSFVHLPWSTPVHQASSWAVPLPPTPQEPKPLDPPPLSEPLCLPPPYRASFKKRHFSSFCTH